MLPSTIGDRRAQLLGLAIRYGALQPLAYSYKDMNFLLYSGSSTLTKWFELRSFLKSLEGQKTALTDEHMTVFASMLSNRKIDYILFDRSSSVKRLANVINRLGRLKYISANWELYQVKK